MNFILGGAVTATVFLALWFFYGLYTTVGNLVKEIGKTLGSLATALEVVMKDLQERVSVLEQLAEFTEIERQQRLHR